MNIDIEREHASKDALKCIKQSIHINHIPTPYCAPIDSAESLVKESEKTNTCNLDSENVKAEDPNVDIDWQSMEYNLKIVQDLIMDFSIEVETRLAITEKFFGNAHPDRNSDLLEILSVISSIYNISGVLSLEQYLIAAAKSSCLNKSFCIKIALILLGFSDIVPQDASPDDMEYISSKNKARVSRSYDTLLCVCADMESIPVPCKVAVLRTMLHHDPCIPEVIKMFVRVINDTYIDADYRYKTILSIENEALSENYISYILGELFYQFSVFNRNPAYYRTLACQYLFEKKLRIDMHESLEAILIQFGNETELDYNRRADAVDVVLAYTKNTETRKTAKYILKVLGCGTGNYKAVGSASIYLDMQNTHNKSIENSALRSLHNLSFTVSPESIDTIRAKLYKHNKHITTQVLDFNHCISCNCILEAGLVKVCSQTCKDRHTHRKTLDRALNRITIDRKVYASYNMMTLLRALGIVYAYIKHLKHTSENKCVYNELLTRLSEELVEMADTCSTGFITRLANVMSGYVDKGICISWDDQIKSNIFGRMQSHLRHISLNPIYTTPECIEEIKNAISSNYPDESIDLLDEKETLDFFASQAMCEMTSRDCSSRHLFTRFFIKSIASIKEEMYLEFSSYMDDASFDLYFTKAIIAYTDGSI